MVFVTLIKGEISMQMYGYTIVSFKHMANKFVVWV